MAQNAQCPRCKVSLRKIGKAYNCPRCHAVFRRDEKFAVLSKLAEQAKQLSADLKDIIERNTKIE
jgi:tRNA(Ile2) C34 agmatinyltransferase TiaS